MMDDESKKMERSREPSSLGEFLRADLPASKYLKRLEEVLGAPGEAEREAAADACIAEPGLLARAVELSRLAGDEKVSSRIRHAIRSWSSEIIRGADPELQDWGRVGSVSPEGELSLLAKRLKNVRQKGSKEEVAQAEQVLRLGLTVIATRAEFDLVAALASIHQSLRSGRLDQRAISKSIRNLSLRASPKLLENLAELTRLVRLESDPLREEIARLQEQVQSLRDRNLVLQQGKEGLQEEVDRLKTENEGLKKRLLEAEAKIGGVLGGADQDMIELRARFRNVLRRKLEPNLNEAIEGLEHDPPNVGFALHRIKVAEREIGKELEWLATSSD
jgi:FtsZ-binding cell division protein ZapB